MMKLPPKDLEEESVIIRMSCMICMAFPHVSVKTHNPLVWHQLGFPC